MTLAELESVVMTPARRSALTALVTGPERDVGVYGLAGSSAAMMLAALGDGPRRGSGPIVVIADSADEAGYLYHDLSRLVGDELTAVFPSGYKRDIKYAQPDPPARILRTDTLNRWERLRFVITYPEALAERVASRSDLSTHTLRLERGRETDLVEAQRRLREIGFRETDYVFEPGQFAVRGSILDIYGFNHELPVRADFFGDEIDTLRRFNVETQLSEGSLDSVEITSDVTPSQGRASLLSYAGDPSGLLIAVRSARYVLDRVEAVCATPVSEAAVVSGDAEPDALSNLVDPALFANAFNAARRLHFTAAADPPAGVTASIGFDCAPQALYHKNFELIADSFRGFLSEGYTIYILSDSSGQQERLRDIFADRGDDLAFTPVLPTLHEGFVDREGRRCVFTDHQIFDRFHKYTLKSERARSGKMALSIKELQAIEPGDYIVHIDHGVGRFAGLLRTDVNGRPREMIKLVYANDDIIFVSIHALHKLSKYRGKDGVPPKVNKLGSGAWAKVKERTKTRLKDIARDLIRLYSDRQSRPGFAFSPDTYLQHELEASFAYEDTPDQLKATQDVKADMEAAKPMDRLVCGDVGFGKTEVAVRAAFKAAVDGKQTAVLVPTTVLAYQHFRTFSRRLRDFPVRVDYLSRARSAAQVKQIKQDLADGKIDILIGTHKLIGKDVRFRDLGLLVIDEEQKFGVAVKEKLKQLKTDVDTLTMSATPIPRTLQFSLMGARDLSAITTPPPNRRPIATSVNPLSDDLVREAINFELSRNGQVFIINNRIEGLYDLERMVRRLVPDARVIVAHGQLKPEALEKAVLDFAAHDYDVLIATTIIESGIDMPNVNTMLVSNAQDFGLSELHQLRGRVGRSDRKAFCYLTVPPGRPLTPVARRRLQAIESFSDLGSGIHIAMQDLDIRGAGNLLGAEQSGFIADLGYETYQKILREAVTELRAEEFAAAPDNNPVAGADEGDGSEFAADCTIETDLELMLPPTYVPGDSERVALYRELDSIERESDLRLFRERLEDRFGRLPDVSAELLRVPRLRRLARRLGIEKLKLDQGRMYLFFVDDTKRAYFQSPMFGRILNYLQLNAQRTNLRDRGGRKSFVVDHVTRVEEAVAVLDDILALPPIG